MSDENSIDYEKIHTYDIGFKAWEKLAFKTIAKFGNSAALEYPGAILLDSNPHFTYGAYTCYAGIAKSDTSGLFLFHLFEQDAYSQLLTIIGGEPTFGFYGGIPVKMQRSESDQFSHSRLRLLNPSNSALGGFNLLIDKHDVYYSAGQFNLD